MGRGGRCCGAGGLSGRYGRALAEAERRAITRLTVAVEGFQKSLDKLDSENRNSHKDIYKRLDGHDTALAEHGQRIKHLEEE